MGTLPINMQSKTKFPGSIFPSRQPLMQDSHRDLFLNDPMLHIAQFLKDGASDVKKELVSSYKIVAGARNNYERIEKVVDVIVSHKRAVAIGIICGAGLYSRVVISPEK